MENINWDEVLEDLISDLLYARQKVFDASGCLVDAIPDEKRSDEVFDFINDICDGEYDSADEALAVLKDIIA